MPVVRSVVEVPCQGDGCNVVRLMSTKRSLADRQQPLCRSCGAKRRWRERHGEPQTPERLQAISRAYNAKHKVKLALHYMRQRDALRVEMVAAYGGVCSHCPENDPTVLVLDHVHDDGADERRRGKWGDPFFKQLKREGWPKERLQFLCHNYNARKEMKRRRAALYAKLDGGDNT